MCPPPCLLSSGPNTLQRYTTLHRFTSRTCRHDSYDQSSRGAPAMTPALLTSQSRPPQRSSTVAAAFSKSARRVTSSGISSTSPPAATTRSAARLILSGLRPVTATREPSRANRSAKASPRPLVAPVMRTRRLELSGVLMEPAPGRPRPQRRTRPRGDGRAFHLLVSREHIPIGEVRASAERQIRSPVGQLGWLARRGARVRVRRTPDPRVGPRHQRSTPFRAVSRSYTTVREMDSRIVRPGAADSDPVEALERELFSRFRPRIKTAALFVLEGESYRQAAARVGLRDHRDLHRAV